MTVVINSLAEGISVSEDPRTTVPRYTLSGMVQDLDPGTDQQLLAQAIAQLDANGYRRGSPGLLTGLPGTYAAGSTILLSRSLTAFPPFDVSVTLHYGPRIGGTLLGPVKLDIGTTLQQGETAFDAANRALPWNMRACIQVTFDETSNVAPAIVDDLNTQGGSVPFYFQQPTATFTTTLPLSDYNVGALSTQYTGTVNKTIWKGEPAGSLLMMAIVGSSDDGEITDVVRFTVNRDIYDYWMPYLRFISPTTGRPPFLTPGQLQNMNGITRVTVQSSEDFNDLPL